MNNDLYSLHHNLILTVTNRYDELLQEQFQKYTSPLIEDDETREIYHTGLTPWLVLFISMFTNKETIFERYYRIIQNRLDPLAKSIIVRWFNRTPSVYKVLSVDSPKEQFIHVQDLKTDEKFFVPYQNVDDYAEDNLLLGILIPYVKHHNFFFTTLKLYNRDEQFYIELLDEYANKEGGLEKHYPEFLAQALHEGLSIGEWSNQLHEEVANLFAEHMSQKGYSDSVIMRGIEQWNVYCQGKNPSIQRAETFAAALDYYVRREWLEEKGMKQVDIAKEYDISPSTLSHNYRQLVEELTEE